MIRFERIGEGSNPSEATNLTINKKGIYTINTFHKLSNPIKYDTTSPLGQKIVYIKKWFIGIDSSADSYYGPTSTTGYYNGYQIPLNGYVIYLNKTSNGPSNYVAIDDTWLIITTQSIAGGSASITTVYDALMYIETVGDMIVVNKDYENFPTGFFRAYDFSYLPSYPRFNSTVHDISVYNGPSSDGTLVNGPYYDATDSFTGGYLKFSSAASTWVSQPTITPGNGTPYTIIVVMRAPYFDTSYGTLVSNSSGGPVTTAYGTVSDKQSFSGYDGSWATYNNSFNLTGNLWYHLAWVVNSTDDMLMYTNGWTNGVQYNSHTTNGGPFDAIGRNWAAYFEGDIAKFHYYPYELSASEISDHYYGGNIFIDGTYPALNPVQAYDVGSPMSNTSSGSLWSYDLVDSVNYPSIPYLAFGGGSTPSNAYGGTLRSNNGYGVISSAVSTGYNAFTISFWMKYNGSVNPGVFIDFQDSGYSSGISIYGILNGTGTFKFQMWFYTVVAEFSSSTNVCDGEWHHIVMTYYAADVNANQQTDYPGYPATKTMYLYIDGEAQGSASLGSFISGIGIGGTLHFGTNSANTIQHNFFLGPIQLYEGFCFGEQQAKQNYLAHVFRFNK